MASGWLAAMLPGSQQPGLKINMDFNLDYRIQVSGQNGGPMSGPADLTSLGPMGKQSLIYEVSADLFYWVILCAIYVYLSLNSNQYNAFCDVFVQGTYVCLQCILKGLAQPSVYCHHFIFKEIKHLLYEIKKKYISIRIRFRECPNQFSFANLNISNHYSFIICDLLSGMYHVWYAWINNEWFASLIDLINDCSALALGTHEINKIDITFELYLLHICPLSLVFLWHS